jgi:hypothetical protein
MSTSMEPKKLLSGHFDLTWSFRPLAGLAELGEEFLDAAGEGLVAFDLAGPVALDGVLDELLLAGETRA